MDVSQFGHVSPGRLIKIAGSDPAVGGWEHRAFLPDPLPDDMPEFSPATILVLGEAHSALAALDNTARHLPNPELLREPTLRREAQSTTALEGTYAPLSEVITADGDPERSAEMHEVMNYVRMANFGYGVLAQGRRLSTSLLNELQGMLMAGTPLQRESGRLRQGQVVIGRRPEVAVHEVAVRAARFVPVPPGDQLVAGLDELMAWKLRDHSGRIDPLVKAGMGHYQFETLHPYRDGNGRLGRYLITADFMDLGVLSEPTLTVSPWFESRRQEYYDHLLSVSTAGEWDGYLRFFMSGLAEAARSTHQQMLELTSLQQQLKEQIRASRIRSEAAHAMVDLAVGKLVFSVPTAAKELELTSNGGRRIIEQLTELGVLQELEPSSNYRRYYFAPRVVEILVRRGSPSPS